MFVNGQLPTTIEIPLKNGSYCFPLTEFSSQKFLLRSIDAYLQLKDAIIQWIKENKTTTYEDYNNFILGYSSVLPEAESSTKEPARKSVQKSKAQSPKGPNHKRKNSNSVTVQKSPNKFGGETTDVVVTNSIFTDGKKEVLESFLFDEHGNLIMKPKEKKYYKNPRHHGHHVKSGSLYNIMTKINDKRN